MRAALRRILEVHADLLIVAEVADGAAAVELTRQLSPQVAVVDIGMGKMNGIDATAQLLRYSPETAVIIVTVHNQRHFVLRAIEAGARGYLLKDSLDEEELVQAIHTVTAGGRYFSAAIATFVPPGSCANAT